MATHSYRPSHAHGGLLAHHRGDASHQHRRVGGPSSAIGWSFVLVVGFGFVEALVGWLAGSLALLSDAVHMLTDAMALGLAWFAQRIAQRDPTAEHSFGFERAETLAAFVNALFYLGLLVAIAAEAVSRLLHPRPIQADWAFPVAVLGLILNAVMLWMLRKDHHQVNIRAAMLHVAGDFAGSVTAVVAIGVAWATGWTRVDPLLAMAISVFMLATTARLIRDTARELMNAVPATLDANQVGESLNGVDGIRSVHDLHIWSLGGGHAALAAHVAIDRIEDWPGALDDARRVLRERFGIEHVTLQPETEPADDCGCAAPPAAAKPTI